MTLTTNQKFVVGTTILTALMHLVFASAWKGIDVLGIDLSILFYINGIGYVVLLVLTYFLPQFEDKRDLMRMALMAFTVGSIIGWILFHPADTLLDRSITNKIVEVVLLVFAFKDMKDGQSAE